jgi:hypothetical protein
MVVRTSSANANRAETLDGAITVAGLIKTITSRQRGHNR